MNNLSIYASALVFFIPISLANLNGVDIPISDIGCLVGIIISVKYTKIQFTRNLYASIILSLVAYTAISLMHIDKLSGRPLLSIAYFFKPYFSIFIAFLLIKNNRDFEFFCAIATKIIYIITLAIFFSVITNHGGIVRNDSYLNGDIFGIDLYGSYGVNSLAIYYLILFYIVLFFAPKSTKPINRIMKISCLFELVYLILLSLSREAIVGLFFLIILHTLANKKGRPLKIILSISFVCAVVLFISLQEDSQILQSKIDQINFAIQNLDINHLTSGRIDLYTTALSQLIQNPLFGNGYYGYQLYTNSIDGFETVEGLSPHNQYITTFWKMGLLASIPYFIGLLALVKMLPKNHSSAAFTIFLSCVFALLANVWDVLIVPNFSALLFFFWGACIKNTNNQSTTLQPH